MALIKSCLASAALTTTFETVDANDVTGKTAKKAIFTLVRAANAPTLSVNNVAQTAKATYTWSDFGTESAIVATFEIDDLQSTDTISHLGRGTATYIN